MAPIPEEIQGVASGLLAELCCRVAASDHPVCRCGFAFGDPPPVSNCCSCPSGGQGEAFVRVGQVYPSTVFPQPDEANSVCDYASFAAVFTVGIYRCAPTLKDNGSAPTTEELAAALIVQLQDRAVLMRTIRCYFNGLPDERLWFAGPWNPIEPQGGCMGGSVTVTVAVDDCVDCPECD